MGSWLGLCFDKKIDPSVAKASASAADCPAQPEQLCGPLLAANSRIMVYCLIPVLHSAEGTRETA